MEHGADDVSLEEIARRAGVGIGTLYRHFPTRQALLEAVYTRSGRIAQRAGGGTARAESPGDALADWMRALVKFSSTKRSMTSALLATLGTDSELLSSCAKEISGRGRSPARPRPAGRRGAPDANAKDLIRLVHAVNIATEKAPDPGQADRMLALILDGLRPQPRLAEQERLPIRPAPGQRARIMVPAPAPAGLRVRVCRWR